MLIALMAPSVDLSALLNCQERQRNLWHDNGAVFVGLFAWRATRRQCKAKAALELAVEHGEAPDEEEDAGVENGTAASAQCSSRSRSWYTFEAA